MMPQFQHLMPSLGTQWNIPRVIPDMGDLLGVDLRHQFSAEVDQVEAGSVACMKLVSNNNLKYI